MSDTPSEAQLAPSSAMSSMSAEFEDNFTAARPPQYNGSNQPSGGFLPVGPSAVPRAILATGQASEAISPQLQDAGQHYPASDSTGTGTVMADEVVAAIAAPLSQPPPNLHLTPRMVLQFYINHDYDGAVQPLTEQAIAAHDYNIACGSGNSNVVEWINGGLQFPAVDSRSLSMSVFRHSRTQTATRTGSTVPSSWSVVSSSALQVSMSGHGDDGVRDTGSQFTDVSAPAYPQLDI
ncbi:hypothetical protein GGR58DRAFT_87319 [Xylaria digitata]|nr:hypothetical protein GGR58DRAFT_87319 [Xylaria digitata]